MCSVDAGTISTRSYTQQDINTQLYVEATPPDTTYTANCAQQIYLCCI